MDSNLVPLGLHMTAVTSPMTPVPVVTCRVFTGQRAFDAVTSSETASGDP